MSQSGKCTESELVSVIIPAYNSEKTIDETIRSVLAQTYKNLEIIVVDDCSTDNTASFVDEYAKKDTRILFLRNSHNCGVANTRNRGIMAASGAYIALLDSDDLWENDKIERQVRLAQRSHAKIMYCSYDFINESNQTVGRQFVVPLTTNFQKMLSKSVISCSTAMIEADLLKKNPFETNIYHEDYALWMKLLSIPATAIGDKKILMHYRQTKGSRNEDKVRAAAERWKIYREYLHLSRAESIKAFIFYTANGVKKYLFI